MAVTAAAAVVAVIVAAGEARAPVTEALVKAAKEAVGSAAEIKVSEASPPSDRAVLRVETALEAVATVALVWDDDEFLAARTRLHVARTDRWISREIEFQPADTLVERGRALGFAIASMLPEGGVDIEITLPDALAARDAALGRHAFEVGVVGTADGSASDVGASIAGELFVSESVSLRVGLGGRYGHISGTSDPQSADGMHFDGTHLTGTLAVGVAWWAVVPSPRSRLGLGLRADLVGTRHQVTIQENETAGRFVGGADLLAQVSIHAGGGVELLVAGGAEITFGNTTLIDDGLTPGAVWATIPWMRAVGEAGVRFRF
jgi:hypothetical protein